MTPEEFCVWLSGFVSASHHHNLTPEAWSELKSALSTVKFQNKNESGRYVYTKNATTTALGLTKEVLHD